MPETDCDRESEKTQGYGDVFGAESTGPQPPRPQTKGRRAASWTPTNSTHASRVRLPRRGLPQALTILVLLCSTSLVIVQGLDDGSQEDNIALQNDRIAVFGTSYVWEPFGPQLARIVNREVNSFISGATTAGGALPLCGIFRQDKYGIIVVEFGGSDRLHDLPWEETEANLRTLFRNLKSTGAVVVYNQVFPDSSEYPYSQLAREEGVIPVPYVTEGIVTTIESGEFIFPPVFDSGDGKHPNERGYSVMAERTAQALLDAGVIDRAENCNGLVTTLPSMFQNATELMGEIEDRGRNVSNLRDSYAAAEYLWENQHCYTAKWELQEKIITPIAKILDQWDEISSMFTNASRLIDLATHNSTLDTTQMLQDFASAEKTWAQLSPGPTRYLLQRILDKQQEAMSALEEFQQMDSEISRLLSHALQLIDELGQRGEDTAQLMAECAKAQDDWRMDHDYDEAAQRLERVIEATEHWGEVKAMFAQASECIETLSQKGDTSNENICRAFYTNATRTWEGFDYEATWNGLSNIIAKCSEPMLLILGLILLPALLRRS